MSIDDGTDPTLGNEGIRNGGCRENYLGSCGGCFIDAEIAQRLAPNVAVGDDDLDVGGGDDLGPEQGEFPHRTVCATDLNMVTDAKGPEDQEHDTGGKIGERAL